MSIRVRVVDGTMIALCAAETDEKSGDLYLDDNVHYALAAKFHRDFQTGIEYPEEWRLMDGELPKEAD